MLFHCTYRKPVIFYFRSIWPNGLAQCTRVTNVISSRVALIFTAFTKLEVDQVGLTIVPFVPWEGPPPGAPDQLPNFYHAILTFERLVCVCVCVGLNVATTTKKCRQLFGGRKVHSQRKKCTPIKSWLRVWEKGPRLTLGWGPEWFIRPWKSISIPDVDVFTADALRHAVTLTFDLWHWMSAVYRLSHHQTVLNFSEIEQSAVEFIAL